jgi:predicted AlkP superfamily pyrophosphatase or phosphodiesterase
VFLKELPLLKLYFMRLTVSFIFTISVSVLFAQQPKSPKLVVGIVVDQMCYEYLYRYQAKFSEGGFKLLMNEGTNCRTTKYNYIPTFTGPGHASIYTGTTPNNHGIVGNDWYDRRTGKNINCVEDSTVKTIGSTSAYGVFSPKNLKANTITDQLKMTYPDAKVISMSIKNRGAILPGGHLSDGSYWYDFSNGKFISSTFFVDSLPNWVNDFNGKNYMNSYTKKEWNTFFDISTYTESGPDDTPYEVLLPGKTTPTFPYNLTEMSAAGSAANLFTYTPFCNTFLTDLAIASLEPEQLGKDKQTDFLCISYSSPDMIGHAFGPQSIEIEDTYIRLDRDIEKLIKSLNEKVGKGEYTLFITADHAVVPVPQYLIDNNLPGGYFFLAEHMADLRAKVTVKYGADVVISEENLNIYLNHNRIDSLKLNRKDVARFVAEEIQTWKHVKQVFTADRLLHSSSDGEWTDMVRKGYHPTESGDIIFMLEPGYLDKHEDNEKSRKGTSHGSAFSYDTHVPLLWYGKNIPKQEVFRQIDITDIAATLAHFLYVQHPNALTGKPIVEILK